MKRFRVRKADLKKGIASGAKKTSETPTPAPEVIQFSEPEEPSPIRASPNQTVVKKKGKKVSVKSKKTRKKPKRPKKVPIEERLKAEASSVIISPETPTVQPVSVVSASSLDDEGQLLVKLQMLAAQASFPDHDELPDPMALIQKAIDSDLDSAVLTEEAFDQATNVIDWCRNPAFLGGSTRLFPRQIQVLAHFFRDLCFFCSDTEYVHNVPVDAPVQDVLDRFTFLENGVCPQCKRNRFEVLDEWHKDPQFLRYNPHLANYRDRIEPNPPFEFVGVWGQRSGKSFLISTFAWTYILHRYLCVPSVSRYFDQADNAMFEASFVAPTLSQVNKYMWLPFRHVYDSSPWFRMYRDHLKYEGKRLGVQLYRSELSFITFLSKRMAIHILAANSSTLRGGTRFFAAVDELGWFTSQGNTKSGKSGPRDGNEVFTALSNSLRTFRTQAQKYRRDILQDYNSLDGYMFNISSPSSVNDSIMRRAAQAKTNPRIYYTHYATWDVNPKEDERLICQEFAGDPVTLQRDFYAIPPKAMSPFISEDEITLSDLVIPDLPHLFDYRITTHKTQFGDVFLRPTPTSYLKDGQTPRVLAIDTAEVRNSFGIAIARYYPEHDGVLYEKMVEVAPYPGHIVDLAWCYDHFILPLVKTYKFLYVVYDRWNSAQAVHDLRTNHNTAAERHSLRWKDFEQFRNDLYSMKLWFGAPEMDPDEVLNQHDLVMRSAWPMAHFQAQLLTVNQFGRRLYKPEGGNDDLFRAAALCHFTIRKYRDIFKKKTRVNLQPGMGPVVGVFGSRSVPVSIAAQTRRRRCVGMDPSGTIRRRAVAGEAPIPILNPYT